MRLLLDTHIWLWIHREPQRLTAAVIREMSAPGAELWLSPISVWEAMMLQRKGRIGVHTSLEVWIRGLTQPYLEASLTNEIAIASQLLPLVPWDPADRFLAATAKVLDLTLVTADAKLDAHL